MHDPARDAPTGALIDHIRTRYHGTHRRELPELMAPARKVEATRATDPNTPHGLTHAFEAMIPALEAHMREEDILSPALRDGGPGLPPAALRLQQLAAATRGAGQACRGSRRAPPSRELGALARAEARPRARPGHMPPRPAQRSLPRCCTGPTPNPGIAPTRS